MFVTHRNLRNLGKTMGYVTELLEGEGPQRHSVASIAIGDQMRHAREETIVKDLQTAQRVDHIGDLARA